MGLLNIFLLVVSIAFFIAIVLTIILKRYDLFVTVSLVFLVISAAYAGIMVFTHTELTHRRFYAFEYWIIFIAIVLLVNMQKDFAKNRK